MAAAARRDEAAVRAALAADQACLRTWMALQVRRITICIRRRTRAPFEGNAAGLRAQVGGKLAKKEGMIKTNLKKVEGLLYDLSIVRAGGVKASVQATQEAAADTAS